jgi:nucleolar protein 58
VKELYRCIRLHYADLLSVENLDLNSFTLGLSHSLGRYKLKFSPDKVDVMIVQAISLLDDLEKEINTYSMRIKEWYGWHFPELVRVVSDNLTYARVVKRLGSRTNFETVDLTDILGEQTAEMVKRVAKISMGTEISEEDISYIIELCIQTIDIFEYKDELFEYLKSRMATIAPNLTVLVGELVGARLIAHAGSLINLAKHPASTVQILGAEKALFRAIKAKKATPKYGVIYNASFVGKSSAKNKGKASRILANKAALSCRVDALGNENTPPIGKISLEKITSRLQEMDVSRKPSEDKKKAPFNW